jgi:hypothetical protein
LVGVDATEAVMDGRNTARVTSGTFHRTSVDATKHAQTTIAHVRQKRTFDEYHGKPDTTRDDSSADSTTKTEFRHPAHTRCLEPLKASEIHSLHYRGPTEYSQRRHLALTPAPTSNPYLSLSHPAYGLPKQLVDNLSALGVKSIYPWQSDCLLKSGALEGEQNLVYTAPTGGGKSLVADVLMIKRVINNPGKKALLVLPYVALVQEKLRWLRQVVSGITKQVAEKSVPGKQHPVWRKRGDEDSVRVVGFFGGSKSNVGWTDFDIAVCTIEKVSLHTLSGNTANI